jgi:hypothetical protein
LADVGLRLDEAKQLTAALQAEMVSAQVAVVGERRRSCVACGRRLAAFAAAGVRTDTPAAVLCDGDAGRHDRAGLVARGRRSHRALASRRPGCVAPTRRALRARAAGGPQSSNSVITPTDMLSPSLWSCS